MIKNPDEFTKVEGDVIVLEDGDTYTGLDGCTYIDLNGDVFDLKKIIRTFFENNEPEVTEDHCVGRIEGTFIPKNKPS